MTLPYESSVSGSRFTTSQVDAVVKPLTVRTDLPVVVYCHGATANGSQLVGAGGAASVIAKATVLAQAGFTVVGPSCGDSWGNSTADSRIDDALTYARNILGCSLEPPILWGSSMGSVAVLNYAADHTVAGVVTTLTIPDLQAFHNSNYSGLAASIRTAYSITSRTDAAASTTNLQPTVTDSAILSADNGRAVVTGTNLPTTGAYVGTVTNGVSFLLSSSPSSQVNVNATGTGAAGVTIADRLSAAANPAINTTALAQVHQLHYYSSDDTASANIAAYAAATGADIRTVGALGHTDAAAAAAPIADFLRFCRHHARKRVTL